MILRSLETLPAGEPSRELGTAWHYQSGGVSSTERDIPTADSTEILSDIA